MRRLFKVGSNRHDTGKVTIAWQPDGNFLASAGKNGVVQITDRHGDIVDEVPMTTPAPIISLSWDKDGDFLAILQDGNGVIPLWSLTTRRVTPLETNQRDPTFLAWSKTGPQLAIGTVKGALLIYNKTKKQKIPIVGKHSKRINCGCWSNNGNKLVLGSDDKNITISNENGDTLLQTELKIAPIQLFFSSSSSAKGNDDDVVSSNLNGKSIHLLNILDEHEDPVELIFQTADGSNKYGEIIHHEWIGTATLLVGFSLGYLTIVGTESPSLGKEKQCQRFHSNMTTFSYNSVLKRVAFAGDDGIHVVDVQDFKESKGDFIPIEDLENGRVSGVHWSPDGQILSICTTAGNVYNFLAKMSILNAKYKTSIAYLSSLREISVVDAIRKGRPIDVSLKLEPSIIAIGAQHVAAGMNNRVYYHKLAAAGEESVQVNDQEYHLGTIREVQLNQHYAVILTDKKAMLHPIEPTPDSHESSKTFPIKDEGLYAIITSIALTDDFLYYGTEAGSVELFFLSEWKELPGAELRLENPIKKIYPNSNGTRVVVVTSLDEVVLFNPVIGGGVNQSILRFENTPMKIVSVIWDAKEKNVIMLYDGKYIHSYVYVQYSMKGSYLSKLGPVEVSNEGEINMKPDKVELVSGNFPLLSTNGVLTCQTVSGFLTTIVHPYFDQLVENINKNSDRSDKKLLAERFGQSLALLKLEAAWLTALELDKRQFWLALSGKAMETLNVELASRVYRQLGDAAMVMALQDCMHIEDRLLLAGHICMLFCDYQRAQDLFLASSRPQTALEMRRDLLQWDQALKLAQALMPSQVPDICVQYGQQLEFRDDNEGALRMFDSAINFQNSNGQNICPEHLVTMAMKGVARCDLRQGNLRQGIRIANDLEDKILYQECGEILEQQKQYSEAVTLHIKGEQYERAAYVYTKYLIKNDKSRISEAAAIMSKVNNDKLNSDFAKACKQNGRYDEAVKAYERAKDTDQIVELKLRHLDQVQQAFDLVRATSSTQGAILVSEYCQENNDFRSAIEFLLIAGKSDDALKLAQTHSLVEVYAAFLGDTISSDDALKVAHHYEKAQELGKAGKYYSLCGQYSRALKLFMQCGDREIDAAIEVVGKSQNESLTNQLIDFLLGEKDGIEKDANYLYRLNMSLKKYEQAAQTALILARQEQDMGQYPKAHNVLYETIRQLEEASTKVPLQLRQQFVLLHSYIRIKSLVKSGDHMGAARLLLRVVQNLTKFPMHSVPILTSTVIECHRAGLKTTAHEYAVMLMRPEYREHIDVNLKRKIEAIVRRRLEAGNEPTEELSPCPITNEMIPITQLESTSRDQIPMCIITGRHMVISDWCFCPVSKMPALHSAYMSYIESETNAVKLERENSGLTSGAPIIVVDPVLGKPVTSSEITLTTPEEATKYIQKYNNVLEEKKKEEGEGEGEEEEKVKEKKVRSNKARARRGSKKTTLLLDEKSKNSERSKKHK